MNRRAYAVATMDTKGHELAFVADRLREAGIDVVTVDVGTLDQPAVVPDVDRKVLIDRVDDAEVRAVLENPVDRGAAVTAMGEAFRQYLLAEHAAGRVAGVIGLGGSGGTAIVSTALKALPIGLPKVMVSTMASGNTEPYVGCSDITMVYSVVDIAGLNSVSRKILVNAAGALAGMIRQNEAAGDDRPVLGLTMFGLTTPCVTEARALLEAEGYDCLVFHATGTGGQAMEKLVEAGLITGVLDVTTTEVADMRVGGVFRCLPTRFEAILRAGVPYVLSLGALDMVNFGARETVPIQFEDRRFVVHNAQVTLMRTTPEENRGFARFIASKLNESVAPLTLLIPEKGLSGIDAPGKPFFDQEADEALFSELEQMVNQTEERRIIRVPHHINDPEFARELVRCFLALARPGAVS